MATAPKPAPAPEAVPETSTEAPAATKRQRPHAGAPRLPAIISAIPAISLGVGFWLLMFREIPAGNKDIALAIGSGLLGYLTHAAQAKIATATDTPT